MPSHACSTSCHERSVKGDGRSSDGQGSGMQQLSLIGVNMIIVNINCSAGAVRVNKARACGSRDIVKMLLHEGE